MESTNLLKYLRVSLTTTCNKQCWYCFREGILEEKSMMTDVATYKWLIELIKNEYALTNIRFTGGEPMLNPLIKDFVHATKSVCIPNIGITTNGYQLDSNFNELCGAGVNSFAVHYTDIDDEEWSLQNTNEKLLKDSRIRYNVVVTTLNINKVTQFLEYCKKEGISLLLLDLLETSFINQPHRNLYYPLQLIGDSLLSKGYQKIIQNVNSVIYVNNSHSIKLVTRYTTDLKRVYCTHKLEMHPILLTSDFNFRLCNHFGSKEINVHSNILSRNREATIDCINTVIQELKDCQECICRTELCDN